MQKHANPFYTINEAMAVLKSIGADPTANLPKSDEPVQPSANYAFPWGNLTQEPFDWREHIYSISLSRHYDSTPWYFSFEIHIDEEGFKKVHELIDCPISVRPSGVDDHFEYHEIGPSPLLKFFMMVEKPKQKEEPKQ